MPIKRQPNTLCLVLIVIVVIAASTFILYKFFPQIFLQSSESISQNVPPSPTPNNNPISQPTPTLNPTPSVIPTPKPKPLTFNELNNLYGPCVHLPVLFYHHIQDPVIAKAGGYQSLNVTINAFKNQIDYLKRKGYNVINVSNLVKFFDNGTPIPTNSVLLTFDDGYEDFYTNAYPILKSNGFQAILFLPTGLAGNPGYLTWDQIKEMANSNLIYFANHTWSHYAVTGTPDKVRHEILVADGQLGNYGLNNLKIFAYPYGTAVPWVETFLGSLNYNLAFSTTPGTVLCKKQRLYLPRVRIGSTTLSTYGF